MGCTPSTYTAQMGIKDRGANYQVFRKGANSAKPNYIFSTDGAYAWDALGYNVEGARLKNTSKKINDIGDNDGIFQFDPVTNMIRTTGNTSKCLYAESNDNGAAVRITSCNVHDTRQWFKVVSENE